MNPKSFKSLVDTEEGSIVELNRLWIDDCLGHNAETILLGSSWKIIRKKYPKIKFVQSFADGRLGCGTIYKASNFKYFGNSYTEFFEHIETGEIYHSAILNAFDSRNVLKNNVYHLTGKLRPFRVKTFRYIYPLYKNKYSIKLKEKPYPEYSKGIEYLPSYKFSDNHYIKLMLIYDKIGRTDLVELCLDKVKHLTQEEISTKQETLKDNHWVQRLMNFNYPDNFLP